jgi:hypothetical protein
MFWEITAAGRSADDIATSRGVSLWAVYKAKARVLNRLKSLLSDAL